MVRKPGMEAAFERMLLASRWLVAPIYLGLVLVLFLLLVIFVREILRQAPQVFTRDTERSILAVLTLIDLSLAGNLGLIVLFSGAENFVSKFDIDEATERPRWMGTVDSPASRS